MSRAYGPGSHDASYEKQGRDYPVSNVRWTENRNMEGFLRLLAERRIDVAPLITHRFPLEQAHTAYQTILDPMANSLAVVLSYPLADAPVPVGPRQKIEIPDARSAATGFRVALVGAGNISRCAHMPALKSLRDVSLRAVYSAGGACGKSYGQRFGAAYCCSDLQGDPARSRNRRRSDHYAQLASRVPIHSRPASWQARVCREAHGDH